MRALTLCLALSAAIGSAGAQMTVPDVTPVTASRRALSETVSILEGRHAASETTYARLFLTAASPSDTTPPPTLTIECAERNAKRTISLYVNFGGVVDDSFPIPFKRTDTELFPPSNPTVPLEMRFVGYIRSKPFRRDWEQLPSGNLRYRNPGLASHNLDAPEFFLNYLRSLPQMQIGAPHREPTVFNTQPLLDAVAHTPLCQR